MDPFSGPGFIARIIYPSSSYSLQVSESLAAKSKRLCIGECAVFIYDLLEKEVMMSLNSEKQDILALFNLEDEDVEDISFSNMGNCSIADVFLRDERTPCEICGNEHVVIKGYQIKMITHSALTDRKSQIRYHARRYQCTICKKTWYEPNPFCFNSMKISALTVMNVLDDLKEQTETFSSVAKRYHISPTSAASIFDQHVRMPRLTLPEYQCWDEAYAFFHKGENSKYVFTILDFQSQQPVDILPSRKKEYLIS